MTMRQAGLDATNPPENLLRFVLERRRKDIMSRGLSRDPDPFERTHYPAHNAAKTEEIVQLGHKYYLRDLPRYFLYRPTLQLPLRDPGVFVNPFREFAQGL